MIRRYLLWLNLVFIVSVSLVFWFHFALQKDYHLLGLTIDRSIQQQTYSTEDKQIQVKRKLYLPEKKKLIPKLKRTDNKTTVRWKTLLRNKKLPAYYTNNFKRDWCRIHQARLDWGKYLGSCGNYTKWGIKRIGWGVVNRTDASKSLTTDWDIQPAGEFTKFFIQSKTLSDHAKDIGGDAWRIYVTGTASVSPTIFDHQNGKYEVVFLLMEPGPYEVTIYLDYSLCDGLKDPPADWYKKGNIQGKNQPDGTLNKTSSYLRQPFGDGKPIVINIPKPKYPKNIQAGLDGVRRLIFGQNNAGKHHKICRNDCNSLHSGGFGRWVNDEWKPFVKDNVISDPHSRQGILWIYGDSVSKMFKEALAMGNFYEVCEKIFSICRITYSWIYNMDGYIKDPGKEPLPDGIDYDHDKVMNEIKKVLYDKKMDENSVLLLNWGIHFAAATNFSNYQKLIDEFVKTVQLQRKRGRFKGKVIWRTTTAIRRERYSNPHKDVRRFLTFPRIILYNAYATSVMCEAGIDIIDVYSMSDSYPKGTLSENDPVHYERHTFESVEALIHKMFKSNKNKLSKLSNSVFSP